jgi:hypothetical protein
MKLEEIITKLSQIEEQAALTLSEYPHGLTVERQRLIVGLAKQLRSNAEDQSRIGKRHAPQNDTEADHLKPVSNPRLPDERQSKTGSA